jgi:hypothetical protein
LEEERVGEPKIAAFVPTPRARIATADESHGEERREVVAADRFAFFLDGARVSSGRIDRPGCCTTPRNVFFTE